MIGKYEQQGIEMTVKLQLTEAQRHVIRRAVIEGSQLDPEREPLPPGDPIAWNAITAGTCLAGSAYQPPRGA